jgi:hypothetical protein
MRKFVLFLFLAVIFICSYILITAYLSYHRLLQAGQPSHPNYSSILDCPNEISYPEDNPASLIHILYNLAQQIISHGSKISKPETSQEYMFNIEANLSEIQVISYPRKENLPFQYAIMIVPCISIQHLYEFLTSFDGYSVIDPVSSFSSCL